MVAASARLVAIGLALAVLAWMALLQTVVTPGVAAPWPLFVVFAGAWAAAAGLLVASSRAGAIFTVVLALASAFGALETHGLVAGWENAALAAIALAAGVAAALSLRAPTAAR